jgi:aryl-alcohol dehydrogenase-like predicted oxidoreductase
VNRREFNGLCVALSSLVTSSGAWAFDAVTSAERTVKFRDGTVVPALGQGSWHLAQGRHPAAEEEEALRTGLSLGMTLIDTAEGYTNGRSEELIGRVIAGQRDRVFLVTKGGHPAVQQTTAMEIGSRGPRLTARGQRGSHRLGITHQRRS